jgi:WD domain, G-beta repeat
MTFDGQRLAAGKQGGVRLWALDRPEAPVLRDYKLAWVGFSPDGMTLVAEGITPGLLDVPPHAQVALVETVSGEKRRFIEVPQRAGGTAISPDGLMLATGGEDGTIRVWSLVTGKEIGQCLGHKNALRSLAFQPQDSKLTSLGEDGTLLVWDLSEVRKRAIPIKELTTAETEKLWEALGNKDAGKAYRAGATLAGSPARTMALLERQLRRIPVGEGERLRDVVEDLKVERAGVADAAMEELIEKLELAAPSLRERLPTAPPAMKGRIEQLLDRLNKPLTDASRLRPLRALEVLSRLDHPDAGQKIKSLSEGAPEALLTRQALTLRRLQLRDLDLFDD